jgi:hypothetical protein
MDLCVLKRSVQQEAGLEVADHPDFDPSNLDESDKPFLIDGRVLMAKTTIITGIIGISGVRSRCRTTTVSVLNLTGAWRAYWARTFSEGTPSCSTMTGAR